LKYYKHTPTGNIYREKPVASHGFVIQRYVQGNWWNTLSYMAYEGGPWSKNVVEITKEEAFIEML